MIEIVLVALAVLLLIGVPVAFALILAALAGILFVGNINPMILPQQVFGGMDSLLLLAIPCFLLAGDLMTLGGMTDRLVAFANALLGRLRGGLALSNVASAVFMSGISGSAVADTSALGRVLIPAMVKEGYSRGFAAALTAAANIVGPIIPPSITFILIGVLANLSITRLFLAGVVPGILYGFAMAAVAWIICHRRNYPVHGKVPAPELWRRFKAAFFALMMPIVILTGIRTGIFNVTECSAIAVLYALIVGTLIHRELTPRLVLEALIRTARTSAVIFLVLGGAQVMAWLLAYEHVPQQVASALLALTHDPLLFLLLVNVLLLVVGTFMENGPALVILIPVLYPAAAQVGVDPIHFSMIMAINLVIGLITPPVAISLSITSLIAGCSSDRATMELLPFFLASIGVLLLLSFFPQLSLWLPNLLLGAG